MTKWRPETIVVKFVLLYMAFRKIQFTVNRVVPVQPNPIVTSVDIVQHQLTATNVTIVRHHASSSRTFHSWPAYQTALKWLDLNDKQITITLSLTVPICFHFTWACQWKSLPAEQNHILLVTFFMFGCGISHFSPQRNTL